MKKTILVILTALLLSSFAFSQEKKEMWPGVSAKILLDNEKVNVTEYTFKPGAVADWHSHPQNSVYTVTDAKMKVEIKDQNAKINEVKAGMAMWSPVITHRVTNVGEKEFIVVITEIK
jgi:quercetin dioxygenase-like cupin family protein